MGLLRNHIPGTALNATRKTRNATTATRKLYYAMHFAFATRTGPPEIEKNLYVIDLQKKYLLPLHLPQQLLY
jgi:hypothetical protein